MSDMEDKFETAAEALEDGVIDAAELADPNFDPRHAAAVEEASADRFARQAFLFGVDKQVFTFLFANCLMMAGVLATWYRVGPGETYDAQYAINGLGSIRGTIIFALCLYGFFTAVLNIFYGQMKIWPYLMAAILSVWVGLGGIKNALTSEKLDAVSDYLKTVDHNAFFDPIMERGSLIAPGYWGLTLGGLLVLWLLINGIMRGASSVKSQAAEEGTSTRRRRK